MPSANQKRIEDLETKLRDAEFQAHSLTAYLQEIHRNHEDASASELQELALEAISIHNAEARMQQRDLNIAYRTVAQLKFPTMLRKMWSGGEVQDWIDQYAEVLKQRLLAHQEDKLDKKETLQ